MYPPELTFFINNVKLFIKPWCNQRGQLFVYVTSSLHVLRLEIPVVYINQYLSNCIIRYVDYVLKVLHSLLAY